MRELLFSLLIGSIMLLLCRKLPVCLWGVHWRVGRSPLHHFCGRAVSCPVMHTMVSVTAPGAVALVMLAMARTVQFACVYASVEFSVVF